VPLIRNAEGTWNIEGDEHDRERIENWNPAYREALARYLTALDSAFSRADQRSQFEFLLSLLRVRGLEDAGWDPYETTLRAIPAMYRIHDYIVERGEIEAAQHLGLWVYGHIVEASEPYELLANLIDVANGGRFKFDRFPPHPNGRPKSPGEKIQQLREMAVAAEMPGVPSPLQEIWNREFRNAIFHADYSFYGSELRTVRPMQTYTRDEHMTILNRALAYHEALAHLYKTHIASYHEPEVIPVHPEFSQNPEERAVVIVREGYGATGLKDAWTREQITAGKIPFRIGRFTPEEIRLLDSDHTLALLPRRPDK
jgi:hypothetical protein